ncbi:MAG: alanine--glyoxylate aminotransferase family protein [Acidobacteria bacterium]|nr:alanine--glyoxylate aminotransferase family protein [Acidobacteriota bacterium]
MIKKRVFTPGPTPIHPDASIVMAGPALHHRKREFKEIFRETVANLKTMYKTTHDVLLFSSSGTGAMESAVVNLVSPGAKVVVGSVGKFGERWENLCKQYGMRAAVIRKNYGESIEAAEVDAHLEKDPEIEAVFIQGTESSTGAAMDLEAIGAVVARHPRVISVVDAITTLGAAPLHTDEWRLDVVIGGSQKALMIPPGLAFVSISPKAWERSRQSKTPRFYFDWKREYENQIKGQTAFTPAVNLVQALHQATRFILTDGVDDLIANAALLARMTREAAKAWGFSLFATRPANALTAIAIPAPLDAEAIVSDLEDSFGAAIAGGQGEMKGKILRVAHLGYYDAIDLLGLLGAMECVLRKRRPGTELGKGVSAALGVLAAETAQRLTGDRGTADN